MKKEEKISSKTKKDIIKDVAGNLGCTQLEATDFIEEVFDTLSNYLKDEHPVKIQGFGTFTPRVREPKLFKNPNSEEYVQVPSKLIVRFRASKKFNE